VARRIDYREELSAELWEQMRTGEYQHHGEIPLEPYRDLSPSKMLLAVERRLAQDAAAISLAAGGSLRGYAAGATAPVERLGREALRPNISMILTAEGAEVAAMLSQDLDRLPPDVVQLVLGAMEWRRLGEDADSPLVGFLSHCIALERHASWWCKRRGLRRSIDQVLTDLRRIATLSVRETGLVGTGATREEVFGSIRSASAQLDDSARGKIEMAFAEVFGDQADGPIDALLAGGRSSVWSLRSLGAHGTIDEISVPKRFDVETSRATVSRLGRRFLVASVGALVRALDSTNDVARQEE